ncbi:MAG: phosphatidate cytidylyltransferase [Candidatus Sumerlaeaceae bacterium]
MKQITSRARTGLFAMAVLVVCLWKPWLHWLVSMIVAVLGFIGIREFHRMGRNIGVRTSQPLAIVMTLALIVAGTAPLELFKGLLLSVLLVSIVGAYLVHMTVYGYEGAYSVVPIAVFGPIYIGIPLALSLQIMQGDRMFLMFGLLLVWLSDIGAYYAGRKYGQHKLAPRLSPKKTIEGALGGLAGCLLVALIFKALVPTAAFDYSWGEAVVVALIVGLIAPCGDLAESILKRDTGIKDSGRGMGGHGGVLDRIDSLLFCFPALYLFLMVTGRL